MRSRWAQARSASATFDCTSCSPCATKEAAMKRTVALGDVHLTRGTPAHVARDVARFLDAHRGERVLFTGDVLDLSADAPHAETKRAHERVLAHPEIARAMAEHLDAEGELFWVAGNHDAAVGSEGFAS